LCFIKSVSLHVGISEPYNGRVLSIKIHLSLVYHGIPVLVGKDTTRKGRFMQYSRQFYNDFVTDDFVMCSNPMLSLLQIVKIYQMIPTQIMMYKWWK